MCLSGLPAESSTCGYREHLESIEESLFAFLSAELSRPRVDAARILEVRRPGSGEISSGGYTYYWSGNNSGACSR